MSQIEHTPSPFLVFRLRLAPAARWFVLAAVGLLLFLGYTALVSTGVFDATTAQIERWLLQRPITRVDCLFYEWRNLGNTFLIVCLTGVLGLVCFLLGYRWSVLPYLALLLFVCLVLEAIGKSNLTQPVPHSVTVGLASINCPQIHNQPASVRLSAVTGMWWNLPPPSEHLVERIHMLAQNSFPFDGEVLFSSYPGGHAMRSTFLGLLICWLCWRHIKRPAIRVPVITLVLMVSLGVGLMQFYLGAHLITDTIAGYLLGAASACCAIGLLLLSGHRPRGKPAAETLPGGSAPQT